MNLIKSFYEIMTPIDGEKILQDLEAIGRVCYKSEDKITSNSAPKFVAGLVKRGHEAMIEHHSITVKFTCDRGVSHEIVRHRVGASYAQESTRYCNYSKDQYNGEITYIEPTDFENWTPHQRVNFRQTLSTCEDSYMALLRSGLTAQQARAVLPNALKTEIVVTMTLRAWRHFFQLRCSESAHPDIRILARRLHAEFNTYLPEVFGDITY